MTDSNFGRQLSDRYIIIDSLGQGSMGKVYLAEDSLLGGVPVAVKFLASTLLNEKMKDRFLREAMTCAQLGQNSRYVVRVSDYGVSEDDVPFYVMEYLKGQSLGELIQSQPLPVPRFLGLILQICSGLQAAHNGIIIKKQVVPIIHRDIKPNNIFVTHDPSVGEEIKILDFGIAKLVQPDSEQTSSFMGTLAYASPEQMEGQELDSRSDIYSLGVMMYQMISGHLPVRPVANSSFGSWYKAHHTQSVVALSAAYPELKIPKPLDEIILQCLEKNRDERPQNIGQLLERLAPLNNRFGSSFSLSQRIGTVLSKLPVVKKTSPEPEVLESEEERFCRLQLWPKGKPIAEIVFPQLMNMSNQDLAALWVMMSPTEIQGRRSSSRYNTFMCTLQPHPMAIWVTALYNKALGPRFLSYYLDLKDTQHQQLTWLLGDTGYYRVLFFSKEFPHRCEALKRFNIAAAQRNLLKEWVIMARTTLSVGNPSDSRGLLKREYDQNLKPKILMYFESMDSDSQPN